MNQTRSRSPGGLQVLECTRSIRSHTQLTILRLRPSAPLGYASSCLRVRRRHHLNIMVSADFGECWLSFWQHITHIRRYIFLAYLVVGGVYAIWIAKIPVKRNVHNVVNHVENELLQGDARAGI